MSDALTAIKTKINFLNFIFAFYNCGVCIDKQQILPVQTCKHHSFFSFFFTQKPVPFFLRLHFFVLLPHICQQQTSFFQLTSRRTIIWVVELFHKLLLDNGMSEKREREREIWKCNKKKFVYFLTVCLHLSSVWLTDWLTSSVSIDVIEISKKKKRRNSLWCGRTGLSVSFWDRLFHLFTLISALYSSLLTFILLLSLFLSFSLSSIFFPLDNSSYFDFLLFLPSASNTAPVNSVSRQTPVSEVCDVWFFVKLFFQSTDSLKKVNIPALFFSIDFSDFEFVINFISKFFKIFIFFENW